MAVLVAEQLVQLGVKASIASGLANLGLSVALSVASNILLRPKGADQARDLSIPTSLPPYRFAYGKQTRIQGSPAPYHVVNNGVLYGCLILNSRPSKGGAVSIFIDKRPVEVAGNIYDFSEGAKATNAPFAGHATFWLGLGDQQGPPAQIMSEMGDPTGQDPTRFWPSDKWSGRTVLWLRLRRGSARSRAERWPSAPPVIEIEADWSRVCDPRNPGQDIDDPSTWDCEDNQGLCMLDALRLNPIERWSLDQIRVDDLLAQADLSDEGVPLVGGGTEPRYRVGGIVVFNGTQELAESLTPMAEAGGGILVKAGGQIGYRRGAYDEPVMTLTEPLRDDPIRFRTTRNSRELPGAVKAVFPDPAAQWEMGELIPLQVDPGWDGGEDRVRTIEFALVPFARQAMRLQQIKARRLDLQKSLQATFPPEVLRLVAGSTAQVSLPRETDRRNGIYDVSLVHPAQWMEKDDGVSFALPVELEETGPSVYAWNPKTDEQLRLDQGFAPIDLSLGAPSDLQAAESGGTVAFDFLAPGAVQFVTIGTGIDAEQVERFVVPGDIVNFQWQWQRNQFAWQDGGMIAPDAVQDIPGEPDTGRAFGTLGTIASGSSYTLRVRALGDGRSSAWIMGDPVQIGFTLGVPTDVSATPGAGQITIEARAPDDVDFHELQVFAANAEDFARAVLIAVLPGDPDELLDYTEDGLSAGETRHYWVRAVTSIGAVGALAAPVSATAT